MKDILITVISILLTVVIIICMVKGLTVGSFHILSISNMIFCAKIKKTPYIDAQNIE